MTIKIGDIPPAPPPAPKGSGGWAKMRRSAVLAVRSLWLHKLRAALSVLGIVIGTAAVIALMAFGKGSMRDALNDIKKQGTNIIVRSVKPSDDSSASNSRSFVANYGLKMADLDRLATFGASLGRIIPMRVFPSEVRYLDRTGYARLVATTADYADVNQLAVSRGRFLTDEDDRNLTNNCVLGAGLADKLFPFEDPLGKTIQMRGHRFLVVGVMGDRTPTGGTGGSQAVEDYNQDVYIAFNTCRVRIGEVVISRSAGSRSGEKVQVSQVVLTVNADFETAEGREKVKAIGNAVKAMMREDHQKEDWAVTVPLDRLEEAERQQDRFTSLLVLIASISLVVGGIGIMNIMLATVTERTREIGIRRALGAKRKDIVTQFLVEAVVQTTVGGMAGVVLGLGIVFILPPVSEFLTGGSLPAQLSYWSIALSVGVSILVGVMFGLYPAWRAARLDPIEALRHD